MFPHYRGKVCPKVLMYKGIDYGIASIIRQNCFKEGWCVVINGRWQPDKNKMAAPFEGQSKGCIEDQDRQLHCAETVKSIGVCLAAAGYYAKKSSTDVTEAAFDEMSFVKGICLSLQTPFARQRHRNAL